MSNLISVALGGSLGAVLRYLLSVNVAARFKWAWSGTLFVNLLGCLILFLLVKFGVAKDEMGQKFIKVGLLGSLTTFSTFSFEVVTLIKSGQYLQGAICIFLNVFFGIVIGVGLLD